MASKRICLSCGKEYSYCPSCEGSNILDRWKINFDTPECKNVFDTLSAYHMNLIDKEEFKNRVGNYDASKFTDKIQKEIAEIIPRYEVKQHYNYSGKHNKYHNNNYKREDNLDADVDSSIDL